MGNCQLSSQMTRFGWEIAQRSTLGIFVCAARRPGNVANEIANGLGLTYAAFRSMRL